jgi:two-component system OmpR family response regulator
VFPRELLARIRAVLRRAGPRSPTRTLVIAGLEVDPAAREARLGADRLLLTALEFDLLLALAERAGRVVSRHALWEAAGRGDTEVGDRTVDVHISRLRSKLGELAHERLKTVRGMGYILVRELP